MEQHLLAHRRRPLARAVLALLWVVALSASTVLAQQGELPATDPTPQQSEAAQDGALALADEAVREWLGRAPAAILPSGSVSAEELCRQLPSLFGINAAPAGTEVRLEDRIEREADDPDLRVFTYAAVRPLEQLDVVEVRLRRAAPQASAAAPEEWEVEFVGFRTSLELSGVRAWLQTPTAWWLFVGFSLLVLVQLATRGSLLRRWLSAGFEVIRQHRRLVVGTLVALYAVFGLGALSGSALPDECETAILEVVTAAVTSLGATDAYASGNVARAAVTTFYQNFMVVTLSVTFSLAALLGVPAYLYAALSFFVQGIPFGLLGGAGFLESLMVLVLLVLELTAYFLVVAGGGMLLVTLFSPGEGRLFRAYRKLLLMLPIAMLLLLVGAWYEPLILLLVP